MNRFAMFLFLSLFPGLGSGEEERKISEYDLLIDSYERSIAVKVDAEYEAAVRDLRTKYVGALERALGTAQSNGQLETALAFQKEIQRVSEAPEAEAKSETEEDEEAEPEAEPEPEAETEGDIPPQLRSLRAVYDQSVEGIENERRLRQAPIDRTLIAELGELTQSLTVAGRLEDAVFVKEKREEWIGKSTGSSGVSKTAKPAGDSLEEWLDGHELYWSGTNANEVVMRFKSGRVSVFADGRRIMEERIKIESEDKFSFAWFGDPNTFTADGGRRSFMRQMGSGGHSVSVREAE